MEPTDDKSLDMKYKKDQEEEKNNVHFTDFTSLPSQILQNYTNFIETKNIHVPCYYKSFEAISIKDNLKYTIRVLDTESEYVKADRDKIMTLFLQETLYLCAKIGDLNALKIEDFTFSRGQVAFVLPNKAVSLRDRISQAKSPRKDFDVKLLMERIISELNFLESKLKLTNVDITTEKMLCLGDQIVLSDWAASQFLQLNNQ